MSDTGLKKLPCPFCETVSQVDRAIFGADSESLTCPQCGQVITDQEEDNHPAAGAGAEAAASTAEAPVGSRQFSPAGFEPAFPVDGAARATRPVFPAEPESPSRTANPFFPRENPKPPPEDNGNLYTIPGTLTINKPGQPAPSLPARDTETDAPAEFHPRPVRKGTHPDQASSADFEFRASFEQPVESGKNRRPSGRLKASARDSGKPLPHREAAPLAGLSVPVEMETQGSASRWKPLAAFMLALTLLVALGLQYAWYNPGKVRANPYTARLASLLCAHLPCPAEELDPARDYQPVALQVRDHPDEAGALLVTFSFRNVAAREVPFPSARLAFFTRDGKTTVASREFMPAEYLQKDLALLDLMPVGSQVQAEISIADPGPEAVNYTLTFSR